MLHLTNNDETNCSALTHVHSVILPTLFLLIQKLGDSISLEVTHVTSI